MLLVSLRKLFQEGNGTQRMRERTKIYLLKIADQAMSLILSIIKTLSQFFLHLWLTYRGTTTGKIEFVSVLIAEQWAVP